MTIQHRDYPIWCRRFKMNIPISAVTVTIEYKYQALFLEFLQKKSIKADPLPTFHNDSQSNIQIQHQGTEHGTIEDQYKDTEIGFLNYLRDKYGEQAPEGWVSSQ